MGIAARSHTVRPHRRSRTREWTRTQYYLYECLTFAWFVFLFVVWFMFVVNSRLPNVLRYALLIVIFFLKPSGWIPFEPYERAMKRMVKLEGNDPELEGDEGATEDLEAKVTEDCDEPSG